MKTRWTEQQVWDWYNALPWLRGCNFIGSDCAGRIDMWQSYGSKQHMETADKELALAEKIGFNTIRIIVEFDVWAQEHDAFMDNLESYLTLAAKHRQSVMVCLAHEAVMCRNVPYTYKPLGKQFCAPGFHQGRLPLSAEEKAKTPIHALQREETREKYLSMVKEIVTKYAQDNRVLVWNVYNEPGIGVGEKCVSLLNLMFEAVRSCDPMQPLCADVWTEDDSEKRKAAIALSDVISYHNYQPIEKMVPQLEKIMGEGRPVLMTEWLNRINKCDVREIYPLLYMLRIGSYCWGFVVGKTQTNEPWDSLWEEYEQNPDLCKCDFTKWQHDLFRPNLRPYDPREMDILLKYNSMAVKRETL